MQIPDINNSLGINRGKHLVGIIELHAVNGMIMEEHLSFSLVFIIIERVVLSVIQLNEAIDTTNGEVLLTAAEFELCDFAFFCVVDGFLYLFNDGFGLEFLLLL